MKKFIRQELLYGLRTGCFAIILVMLTVLTSAILYLNHIAAVDTYSNYLRVQEYYQENGLDIQADLQGDYTVTPSEQGDLVSNPLLYYKELLEKSIFANSFTYGISQILESSAFLFPFVFGLLGVIIATYDYKNKTTKMKIVRASPWQMGIAKQIALLGACFAITGVALLFSFGMQSVLFSLLKAKIPIAEFNWMSINMLPILPKLVFALLQGVLFSEIGYTLGILFKHSLIGSGMLAAYSFILPPLGQYDLKNTMHYWALRIFDYYGNLSLEPPHAKTTVTIALLVPGMLCLACIGSNLIIVSKRSSF